MHMKNRSFYHTGDFSHQNFETLTTFRILMLNAEDTIQAVCETF